MTTTILHLPARPDAPIACDMRTAVDTPDQRLHEYERLFQRALRRRERRANAVVFAFVDEPEILSWVEDLAHREAANMTLANQQIGASPIAWHPGALRYFKEKGITPK